MATAESYEQPETLSLSELETASIRAARLYDFDAIVGYELRIEAIRTAVAEAKEQTTTIEPGV